MPFEIIHSDITLLRVDTIVNPTDSRFSGSGGTDRAIHRAAGPLLRDACKKLEALHPGEVAVTPGFDLSCQYIFHTMGPVWTGGRKNEGTLLRSCYLNALMKAGEMGLSSIAFPLISSGTFGFPKDKVLVIAAEAIRDYLMVTDGDLQIYLCVYDKSSYEISRSRELMRFLGEKLSKAGKSSPAPEHSIGHPAPRIGLPSQMADECCAMPCETSQRINHGAKQQDDSFRENVCCTMPCEASQSLDDWLKQRDDSFAVTLLKLIDQKNTTEVQCYKRANVSKKTFWKINNDPKYKPSKPTVLAFAIALELSLPETEALLRTVGFSLSHSNVFDMIIEFYIRQGIYDIYEINAALYQFDQVCLGC